MVAPSLYRTAVLGSGFMAQLLCSSTFVSHRDPQAVLNDDMTGPGYELLSFFRPHVAREAKRVTVSMFGLGERTSIFREGLGCTLVVDGTQTGSARKPMAFSRHCLHPTLTRCGQGANGSISRPCLRGSTA